MNTGWNVAVLLYTVYAIWFSNVLSKRKDFCFNKNVNKKSVTQRRQKIKIK